MYRLDLIGFLNSKSQTFQTLDQARDAWKRAKSETWTVKSLGTVHETHWNLWELWKLDSPPELVASGSF